MPSLVGLSIGISPVWCGNDCLIILCPNRRDDGAEQGEAQYGGETSPGETHGSYRPTHVGARFSMNTVRLS